MFLRIYWIKNTAWMTIANEISAIVSYRLIGSSVCFANKMLNFVLVPIVVPLVVKVKGFVRGLTTTFGCH